MWRLICILSLMHKLVGLLANITVQDDECSNKWELSYHALLYYDAIIVTNKNFKWIVVVLLVCTFCILRICAMLIHP